MTSPGKSIALQAFFGLLAGAIVSSLCPGKALADDGGISFGGSPHLLKSHASVSMQSEVVTIDVHEDVINVDCQFVFHNQGPACTVRMGFPDQGLGAAEPYQGDPVPTGPKLHATFLSYDSYVDGKKVPTKVVPTNSRSLYWHVKTVTFKGHADCLVHDVYKLPPGAQDTSENGMYRQTYYILHTGASWHGPIQRAEIVVNFAPDSLTQPIILKTVKSVGAQNLEHLKWSKLVAPDKLKSLVFYDGPCAPTIEKNTLRFVRTNFEPTEKDDVHLFYAFRKLGN
jgi:hypothetical protein